MTLGGGKYEIFSNIHSFDVGRTDTRRTTGANFFDCNGAQHAGHACINIRLPTKGGLYTWEFGQDGRDLNVRVEGPLILNDVPMILKAASEGIGLACVMADQADAMVRAGKVERVLEDWCPPFSGYHLYYPDRRVRDQSTRDEACDKARKVG